MFFKNSHGRCFRSNRFSGTYEITNDPQTWSDEDEEDEAEYDRRQQEAGDDE
jgi:hypothetical protein